MVACAALHNIAVTDRAPVVDVLQDNALDAYVARHIAPDQPQDFNQEEAREEDGDARDTYARINFHNYHNNNV